ELTVSVWRVGILAVRDLRIADAVGDDERIPARVFHRASERQIVCRVAERFGVGESHRIDGARDPDSAHAPYLAGRTGASRAVALGPRPGGLAVPGVSPKLIRSGQTPDRAGRRGLRAVPCPTGSCGV